MLVQGPSLKLSMPVSSCESLSEKRTTSTYICTLCFAPIFIYRFKNFCFRKLEKEIRKSEKEAKKNEEKAARKQEKDAAKAEKMYRNTISARSQISRSTERVGSRSGSLERRRSGDGEVVVLNQSTVHGIFYIIIKTVLSCYLNNCVFLQASPVQIVDPQYSTFFVRDPKRKLKRRTEMQQRRPARTRTIVAVVEVSTAVPVASCTRLKLPFKIRSVIDMVQPISQSSVMDQLIRMQAVMLR